VAQIINLTSAPNQSFVVQLQVDDAPLTLRLSVQWSAMAGYWTLTVFDANGDLLLDSVPMITGSYPAANILGQQAYLQIGSACLINNGGTDTDYPGIDELGGSYSLLWDDTPN
jgi:hypothetical protein